MGRGSIGFGIGNAQRACASASAGFDGEIRDPYVLKADRGRGAGRSLVAATAAGLPKDGYRAAGTWVLRTNAAGRRFVEGLGGTLLDGPEAIRGHGRFTEVAYRWRDLASLATACDSGSRLA